MDKFKRKFHLNIPFNSNNEIGELSNAFNEMILRLKKNIKELNKSYVKEYELQQYLNNILGSVATGILVINKLGNITVFNKEAEKISKFDAEVFIHKNILEFLNEMI